MKNYIVILDHCLFFCVFFVGFFFFFGGGGGGVGSHLLLAVCDIRVKNFSLCSFVQLSTIYIKA